MGNQVSVLSEPLFPLKAYDKTRGERVKLCGQRHGISYLRTHKSAKECATNSIVPALAPREATLEG